MTEDEAARARRLLQGLRTVAKTAGPGQSWWDVIVDGEALLRGEHAPLWGDDVGGWIAQADLLLAAAAPWGGQAVSKAASYPVVSRISTRAVWSVTGLLI